MGKVEEALRANTLRLVRREIRSTVVPLSRDVRELKRAVSQLRKAVAALERGAPRRAEQRGAAAPRLEAPEEEVRKARFSPALISKLRARLDLTQAQVAALLGVTGAAVAQWEGGQSSPRGSNRAALVALRKLGRREVTRLLARSGVPPRKRRVPTKKARKRARKKR